MSASKKWLPEVDEPLGMTNTECFAQAEIGDEPTLVRLSPATDDAVWLEVGGVRYRVRDEHLAYLLAGARKARADGALTEAER